MRTPTPVVIKGSGRDGDGVRRTRQAWVLPSEPEFPEYFAGNLRRKAHTLGLDPDVELDAITWVGPKRSFAVSGGLKPGAPVEAELRGAPETLRAIWSWAWGRPTPQDSGGWRHDHGIRDPDHGFSGGADRASAAAGRGVRARRAGRKA